MAAASAPGLHEETFFEPTRIWLFGKKFPALTYERKYMRDEFSGYDTPAQGEELMMPPKRIERTLRKQKMTYNAAGKLTNAEPPIFARIYSFSFEGHYYKLPRPLLFLVANNGVPAQHVGNVNGHPAFFARETGLGGKDWNFSDDLLAWKVDRKDLTVCLDIEVGNYQEILLNSASGGRAGSGARGDMVGRGDMTGRGSFRGDMIGPHQG